ncbi:DEAD/DEAH box helicase [Myxococcota bacterium]|nr:DEAD/DEAH box helicase [Myxococcota bacterium]
MDFAVGSLVRARGREWVVLPESEREQDVLWLRPLGGTDDEIAGLYRPLEPVEPAVFRAPDPERELGNHRSLALLRDALRLGFRSGAGPFRCFARLGVEPRPYQLVPLLLALRQDIVRLLIADDVGIGKTVEALLIARELLDRAEIQRIAVLCPPHLADGWVQAMRDQFHLDAVPVLSGTAARLERTLGHGESLFDRHPFVVVSMDFIKSERRRAEFIRACPELVIVDEAHGCSAASGGRAAQQRHAMLKKLAADPGRHLLLVTATPHSGNEENFRSLLTLLDPDFADLPLDLTGEQKWRERLARHLVQRRRVDIRAYLDADTPFPDRLSTEQSYEMSPAYRGFLDRVIGWCRERIYDPALDERRQRVQWWSALALLRALSSSPRAAAATLRARARSSDAESVAEVDEIGRRAILDQDEVELDGSDATPGSQTEIDTNHPEHRRLLELARDADRLEGKEDRKATEAVRHIRALLEQKNLPIVFCRFLATVDYLGETLRKALGADVHVECITGALHPEERARRIEAMSEHPRRVLVCTDCLSEGINLQGGFDTVFHYDLSWNPTRHEQRDGRVDRFGQVRSVVKTVTFYGKDNPVDGVVLDVLLRKHRAIHKSLGISVPVPMDTDAVIEALLEGGVLRKGQTGQQLGLFASDQKKEIELKWDRAADREQASRAIFAQHAVKVDVVRAELEATRQALGDDALVERFVRDALRMVGPGLPARVPAKLLVSELPAALRDAMGIQSDTTVCFADPAPSGVARLRRTHPVVAGLADWMSEAALDPLLTGPARRCGVVRTAAAEARTTVLLLRVRMQIFAPRGNDAPHAQLAEDLVTVGFRGSPDQPLWLEPAAVEALLQATPDANIALDLARGQVRTALAGLSALQPALDQLARARADALLDAHRRVRQVARQRLRGLRVEPWLPADVLGLYIYLPVL